MYARYTQYVKTGFYTVYVYARNTLYTNLYTWVGASSNNVYKEEQ